ncbi:AI-2E family transporter [Dermacoccus barathri]|uniref:AI-2E family transporter n=1 Tax=Dermacoccus barathri TaxID=322601 RepID=A0ABN2C3I9_9MICO
MPASGSDARPDQGAPRLTIALDPRSVWRATWVVLGTLGVVAALGFISNSAGSAIFTILMAFFLAVAMEPAVRRLAKHMPRALATGVVVLTLGLAIAGFFAAFGSLLVSEIQALVTAAPGVVTDLVRYANEQFDTDYDINTMLSKVSLTPERVASYGSQLAGGVLGLVTSIVSTAFNTFVLVFFTCYISAGMPRLRTWIAGLFRPSQQRVVLTVWEVFVTKVGGYVAARCILATISATVHGTFMMIIGMPYWLALGLWTGLVAQFIPNIGTYISIVLPVLVGLTSDKPVNGLVILVFAIIYQQIENITIEPNISAKAVDVHPAVSFASALLGAQMFGLAGGILGVPMAATAMALLDLYKRRYEISDETRRAAERDARREVEGEGDDERPPGRDEEPPETSAADDAVAPHGATKAD